MDNPINKDLTNYIIAKNYKLIKRVGSGAFGEIYLVQNRATKEEFAMKLERSDTKHPQLFFEAKLYNYLNTEKDDKGIPRVYTQGTDGDYNYMVMDLLGASLEDLFQKYQRRFSLKTVLILADQMVQRVEFVHSRSFLHRDIKPDNFLMGTKGRAYKLFIVDFGLAKRYMSKDGHIPYKEGKSLTGTARYASINTHMGLEQSRRDDLESVGYVIMYLLRGQLPWQNMKATNQKDKYQRIMEKKLQTPSEVLCKGFPQELAQYLNYCKALKFEEKPDYSLLRSLIKDAMKKNSFEMDYKYDWEETPTPEKQVESMSEKVNKTQPHQEVQLKVVQQPKMAMLPKTKMNGGNDQLNNNVRGGNGLGGGGEVMRKITVKQTNVLSVEKKRNQSLTQQHSGTDILKLQQQQQLRVQPKIVTTKEPYRKF